MLIITKGETVAHVPIENLEVLCPDLCGWGMNEQQTIAHKGLTLRIDVEN